MIKNVENPWIILEPCFDTKHFLKYESIMSQGNGYLGLRASHEEAYLDTVRGTFITGTYNRAGEYESSELPNIADITEFSILLDNQKFNLLDGKIIYYKRYLDIKSGELVKEVIWENERCEFFSLIFKRFVSNENLHLIAAKVIIIPFSKDVEIEIITGINGRITNSGVQHFHEIEKRVYENKFLQFVQRTTESNIDIILSTAITSNCDIKESFSGDRRRLMSNIKVKIKKGQCFELEKKSIIITSLDKDFENKYDFESAKEIAIQNLKSIFEIPYDTLLNRSAREWKKYYDKADIIVESKNNFDQLAINFSLYHLRIMTPFHDHRYSIGAKGLTGEGYKGHVFWDTEIFILPYFLHTQPEIARQLLEYRYNNLKEAQQKAKTYGYKGALFPWESCLSGKEETPNYAAMNIKTGQREKVWSALKEHHIVADIAYAVLSYYKGTNDTEFIIKTGIEILIECSKFWISRAKKAKGQFVILDVIGPDEYTEHIDNNAYTNYLAWYTVREAIKIIEAFNIEEDTKEFRNFVENLYLPKTNKEGIIPQDDTFLNQPIINVTKYKESEIKQTILKDYTRHEVVNLQVLKQADVVMLIYLLNELFDQETAQKNWRYYEDKTIHDSSLSMAVHSIVATYFGDVKTAYKCFEAACRIDLGENIHSSDEGIHAAAIGGIWLAVINGFAGLNTRKDILELNPNLPSQWDKLSFKFLYKNIVLKFYITKEKVSITKISKGENIDILIQGKRYVLYDSIDINIKRDGYF